MGIANNARSPRSPYYKVEDTEDVRGQVTSLSSALEWYWYILASTIYFFVLTGVTVRLAARADRASSDEAPK